MKPAARHIHILRFLGLIEKAQKTFYSLHYILPDPAAIAAFVQ